MVEALRDLRAGKDAVAASANAEIAAQRAKNRLLRQRPERLEQVLNRPDQT